MIIENSIAYAVLYKSHVNGFTIWSLALYPSFIAHHLQEAM